MRRGRLGFWFRVAVFVVKPPLIVLTRPVVRGAGHLPRRGGVIVAVNHISYADPLVVARFLYDHGRVPRFMAKSGVFRIPVLGRVIRWCGQIPVYRNSESAGESLRDAVAALERGECVVIYPEGTVTKDPDFWPMRARTGVARLALLTGMPVLPLGQWGAQEILGRDLHPHLRPRRPVHLLLGEPVDLSGYSGQPTTAPVLREVTDLVMSRVREQVAVLRAEPAPAEVFDPRAVTAVPEPGNRRTA